MEHTPGANLLAYLAENDGACFGCRYNLRGLKELRCPECRMSFEFVDVERFCWINKQMRFESKLLLFALITLGIEAAIIAPFILSMFMGFAFALLFQSELRYFLWPALFTAALGAVFAIWVTAWIVFFRAYRKPLGRFAALADDSRKITRIGRAAIILDVLGALLGLVILWATVMVVF